MSRKTLKRVVRVLDALGPYLAIAFVAIGFKVLHNQGQVIHRQQVQLKEQQVQLRAQVHNEAVSRSEQTAATINARLTNCESGNRLREGLRENVEQGQKNFPLFLELLPQFDTPKILAINQESVDRQLRAFAPLDCRAYAVEILPGH
jgi:hypothetical protein